MLLLLVVDVIVVVVVVGGSCRVADADTMAASTSSAAANDDGINPSVVAPIALSTGANNLFRLIPTLPSHVRVFLLLFWSMIISIKLSSPNVICAPSDVCWDGRCSNS